ncbi:hypothetical protein LCGC14_2823010 [marine sediment metagenome]|uniref:Uncharacterized protein n=1 Tax=marine sediment metagenome TaxID=412755 RepID=A0A0F8YG89_9ZZZZ
MLIDDGLGSGRKTEVNKLHQLVVRSIVEQDINYVAEKFSESYFIQAVDAGPVAGEYTLYFKNDSETDFVINAIDMFVTDADVVWKLTEVTGTAGGASVITPVNFNLGSGKTADATVRGGAAGVGSVTPGTVLRTIYGGSVFNRFRIEAHIIIPKDKAIAFEYDAGTGGAVTIGFSGFYKQG